MAVDDKVAAFGDSGEQRGRDIDDRPSILITPPPTFPPADDHGMAQFAPPTRRERFVWGIRYYGFVIGILFLGLTIVGLTIYVLADSAEPDEELLTADELAQLERLERRPSEQRAAAKLVPASLSVVTSPSGAEVRIDGEVQGVAPLVQTQMKPGYHLLSVSYPGLASRDTLVELSEGARSQIRIALREPGADVRQVREPPELVRVEPAEPPPTRSSTPPETERPAATREALPRREVVRSPAVQTGALAIVAEPSDARVILDGAPAGTAPIILADVPVGEHDVVIHAPGFSALSRTVTVEAGNQQTLRVELQALEGQLSVLVRPWGSIYVQGNLVKRDTDVLFTTTLPSGFHTIRVTHPVLGNLERTVEVRPGQATHEVFEFESN